MDLLVSEAFLSFPQQGHLEGVQPEGTLQVSWWLD